MIRTDTKKTTVKIFAARQLAGDDGGSDAGAGDSLQHAVADLPFAVGRLKRMAREALCDKTIALVDPFGWQAAGAIDCPRCRDIAQRLSESPVTKFRSVQCVWAEAQEDQRPAHRDRR